MKMGYKYETILIRKTRLYRRELIEYVEETYKESDNDATKISINLMIHSWIMNNRSESYDSMTNTLEYLKRKGLIKSIYIK